MVKIKIVFLNTRESPWWELNGCKGIESEQAAERKHQRDFRSSFPLFSKTTFNLILVSLGMFTRSPSMTGELFLVFMTSSMRSPMKEEVVRLLYSSSSADATSQLHSVQELILNRCNGNSTPSSSSLRSSGTRNRPLRKSYLY